MALNVNETPTPAAGNPANSSLFERADVAAPPAGAPGARRRAPHDDLLLALGRRFRGAALEVDFELRTATARQVFRRDFVYVSRQLHALESSRRVQALDRELLARALSAVEQRATAARAGLQRCAAEMQALIAPHADAAAPMQFARPVPLQATIVSPYARLFLELLTLADGALAQIEKAWLLGLVDPATKTRRATECRRALQGFKETARQQRHVVGEHVRRVNAKPRPEAPAASVGPQAQNP